jgi:hypothetical protein
MPTTAKGKGWAAVVDAWEARRQPVLPGLVFVRIAVIANRMKGAFPVHRFLARNARRR